MIKYNKNKSKRKLKEKDKKIIASAQEWKCKKCFELLPSSFQVDHIIPFSISKNDSHSNLEALCPNCHSKKTQKEHSRIIKYKKLKSILQYNICWFCLVSIEDDSGEEHICNQVLKNIDLQENENKKDFSELDKYYFTDTNKTLWIKLFNDSIFVNNYFTIIDDREYNLSDIVKAIKTFVKMKDEKYKYYNIKITANINNISELSDDFKEYMNENLIKNIPKYVFKRNRKINIIYDE